MSPSYASHQSRAQATPWANHESKLCISTNHEPELRLGPIMGPNYASRLVKSLSYALDQSYARVTPRGQSYARVNLAVSPMPKLHLATNSMPK
ncbi:hypothetical protein BHM03_00012994 [Ensete ventricosum]|nr:hypothetical protein BHM03_00012994 [Ensete ventricosum]